MKLNHMTLAVGNSKIRRHTKLSQVLKTGQVQSYLLKGGSREVHQALFTSVRSSRRELDSETDATSQVNKQLITKYRGDDPAARRRRQRAPSASEECLGIILPKSEGRHDGGDGDDERLEKRGRRDDDAPL
jgi:hypothetical protein